MAAVTDVALFLPVGWNKGQPHEQMPAIRSGLNLPTALWEILDPATKDIDRFSRGTPLSFALGKALAVR
jgi:hypothetical protein